MKEKEIEIRKQLDNCYGTEAKFHEELFKDIFYSDGVKKMYILCEAHWLLIDSLSNMKLLKRQHEFVVSKLYKKEKENTCYIDYEDGNNNLIKSVKYPYITFLLSNQIEEGKKAPAMVLFFQNDMLYLPSEYKKYKY